MSRELIDLTGQRFGRLTVLGRDGTKKYCFDTTPTWRCRCDCGKECIVLGRNLRSGATRSCGCLRVEVSRENGHARRGKKRGERSR